MSRRIPKRLTICGEVWRVETDQRLSVPLRSRALRRRFCIVRGQWLAGYCDSRDRTIHLAPWLSRKQRWEVFVHEVLHALFPVGDVSLAVEERLVEHLTPRLVDVLALLTTTRRSGALRAAV